MHRVLEISHEGYTVIEMSILTNVLKKERCAFLAAQTEISMYDLNKIYFFL